MNAITHDSFGLAGQHVQNSMFRQPSEKSAPQGHGLAPLGTLLSLISRRSESYAFRYDGGEWSFKATDQAMFNGKTSALTALGITGDHRVERTDSPVKFDVISSDGSKRQLELVWDSISEDVMSMPPHVKPYSGAINLALLTIACGTSWACIYGGLNLLGIL